MKLIYSDRFKRKLRKVVVKNARARARVSKQLKLLLEDFIHPSLKTHKLKGKRTDQYSIWIEGNLRITFVLIDGNVFLTDVVNHDQY